MSKKDERLKHVLTIRLSYKSIQRLKSLMSRTNCTTLSEFARAILIKEKVDCYYRNGEMRDILEELIAIRMELKSIGVNLNQLTRYFHQVRFPSEKLQHASKVVQDIKGITDIVQKCMMIISKLSIRWS